MGINIIEKHITDDLKKKVQDYESAIEAKKFKKFVDSCNNFKALSWRWKKKILVKMKTSTDFTVKKIFLLIEI